MSKFLSISVAAVAISAVSIFSEIPSKSSSTGTTENHGQYFIDKDGDGLCDNTGTHQGQGKNGQNKGLHRGKDYVDANKDGICDNAGTRKGGNNKGNGNRNK